MKYGDKSPKMIAGQSRMMPLCLYFQLASMANLIFQKNAFLLGASLPGPPIFEAISHYPSLCYFPPGSIYQWMDGMISLMKFGSAFG
jgi:hypothetical protein